MFGILSRPVHGHRVLRRFPTRAARNVLFRHAHRMHQCMIYCPRCRSRFDRYLRKNKSGSLKIHPSNPSIHPNRLPPFHRSRLFRTRPRSRRSVSRSRLAAANRLHPSSHRNQCKLHQRSSCPPSVKSRSQTPHRERNPGAALIFGREIQSRLAHQRRSRKRLHPKPLQSGQEKQLHKMHSGGCSKRAIPAQQEQPPQPRKS